MSPFQKQNQTSTNTWTVKKRLQFLTGFFLVMILTMGGGAFWNSSRLAQEINDLADLHLPAVDKMAQVDMMHDGIRASAYNAILISDSKDEKRIEEGKAEFKEMAENIDKYLGELDKLPLDEKVHKEIEAATPDVRAYVKQAQEIADLAFSHKRGEAEALMPKLQTEFEKLEKSLGDLGDEIAAGVREEQELAHEYIQKAKFLNIFLLVFGIGFGGGFAFWISNSLSKTLSKTIATLSEESRKVEEVSTELASTANQLNASTQQQASGVQEVAASIEEINAMVAKTAENASKLDGIARKSHESASQGQDSIGQVVSSMQGISESNSDIMRQVEESNQQISEVVKVIHEIGEKTKVINDIVFQTKLLSFNASVEAARAGEHGKGFAVVAEEVGNLAQMSGNAAKEISEMLSEGIERANRVVAETQEKVGRLMSAGKARVEAGVETARQCGEVFNEIADQVNHVTQMVGEISSAIQEQTSGTAEITKAMNMFNTSTQQNSQATTQVNEIAGTVMNQASTLSGAVNGLEALVGGGSGTGKFSVVELPSGANRAHSDRFSDQDEAA